MRRLPNAARAKRRAVTTSRPSARSASSKSHALEQADLENTVRVQVSVFVPLDLAQGAGRPPRGGWRGGARPGLRPHVRAGGLCACQASDQERGRIRRRRQLARHSPQRWPENCFDIMRRCHINEHLVRFHERPRCCFGRPPARSRPRRRPRSNGQPADANWRSSQGIRISFFVALVSGPPARAGEGGSRLHAAVAAQSLTCHGQNASTVAGIAAAASRGAGATEQTQREKCTSPDSGHRLPDVAHIDESSGRRRSKRAGPTCAGRPR